MNRTERPYEAPCSQLRRWSDSENLHPLFYPLELPRAGRYCSGVQLLGEALSAKHPRAAEVMNLAPIFRFWQGRVQTNLILM